MSEMNITELARRLSNAYGDPEKFGDSQPLLDYLEKVENVGNKVLERIPLDEQAAAHSVIQTLTSLHLMMDGNLASAMFFGTPTKECIDAVYILVRLTIGVAVLEEWR